MSNWRVLAAHPEKAFKLEGMALQTVMTVGERVLVFGRIINRKTGLTGFDIMGTQFLYREERYTNSRSGPNEPYQLARRQVSGRDWKVTVAHGVGNIGRYERADWNSPRITTPRPDDCFDWGKDARYAVYSWEFKGDEEAFLKDMTFATMIGDEETWAAYQSP